MKKNTHTHRQILGDDSDRKKRDDESGSLTRYRVFQVTFFRLKSKVVPGPSVDLEYEKQSPSLLRVTLIQLSWISTICIPQLILLEISSHIIIIIINFFLFIMKIFIYQ